MVLFHLQSLEIVDQDREPSEKLGSQKNRCDQVMRTKSFWRLTRFRFSGPGPGQGRQNAPKIFILEYLMKGYKCFNADIMKRYISALGYDRKLRFSSYIDLPSIKNNVLILSCLSDSVQ